MVNNLNQNYEGDKPIEIKKIFDLIDDYGNKALGDEWSFYPEVDLYSQPDNINPVAISYKIIEREHFKQSARKPAYKSKKEEDGQTEAYIEKGEQFVTQAQFGIWGRNYDEVNTHREWFEKFVFTRKSDLLQEGVFDFLFEQQLEDAVIEINNNYYVQQRIRYYIRHSRILKKPYEKISGIDIEETRLNPDYYSLDSARTDSFFNNN